MKYNGIKYKIKLKTTKEGIELRCDELELSTLAPNTTIKEIKGKIEIRQIFGKPALFVMNAQTMKVIKLWESLAALSI